MKLGENMSKNSIKALSSYPDTRVVLSKNTSELALTLPLYADNKGAFLSENDMKGIV